MARRLTAVLLLFAASLASAQTTTGSSMTVTETNDSDRIINIAECNNAEPDKLIFNWTYSGYTITGTYRLTISDTSGCPSTAHNKVYDNIGATAANGAYPSSGDPTVNVATLLQALSINCSGAATAIYLCVDYLPSSGASTTGAVTGSVTLDLAKPPPPVVAQPTPGDGALNISWTAGVGSADASTTGTSSSYDVVVTNHADPADTRTQSVSSSTSLRVGGLQNGQTYDVTVYAFSPGDNQSDASNVVSGIPVPVADFWRMYRGLGGKEQGGCSTGAAEGVALMALVPFALRRRRRS